MSVVARPRRAQGKTLIAMPKSELKEKVLDLSEGLLPKMTDVVLFCVFYGLELSLAGYGSKNAWRATTKASKDLKEFNYEIIRRALYQIKKRGLVTYIREETYLKPEITKMGKRRLESLFPVFDEERVWNGKFYLVNYDIPTKKNPDRDTLREHLRKIGCGLMLHSTWIAPYDPRETLRKFIKERGLSGAVIISELGKDGSIGEIPLEEILERVYKLSELNDRYDDFIEKYKNGVGESSKTKMAFEYMSILKDDPQLPFELEPRGFLGFKAYKLFKKLVSPK